jgi:phage terminase large subunit-like protein
VPDLKRIVIAVDPSVSTNEGSNETGIIAIGLGTNNHADHRWRVASSRQLRWPNGAIGSIYNATEPDQLPADDPSSDWLDLRPVIKSQGQIRDRRLRPPAGAPGRLSAGLWAIIAETAADARDVMVGGDRNLQEHGAMNWRSGATPARLGTCCRWDCASAPIPRSRGTGVGGCS